MRVAIFFLILALMAWIGVSSPVDHDFHVPAVYRSLVRRSPRAQDVKTRKTMPHHQTPKVRLSQQERNLRKGEYMCNGRVCKLVPGQVPAGCNGVCQHRI